MLSPKTGARKAPDFRSLGMLCPSMLRTAQMPRLPHFEHADPVCAENHAGGASAPEAVASL
jgi:hypothetical protein